MSTHMSIHLGRGEDVSFEAELNTWRGPGEEYVTLHIDEGTNLSTIFLSPKQFDELKNLEITETVDESPLAVEGES